VALSLYLNLLYKDISLFEHIMGCVVSFVVFSHGFHWANGFGAHGIELAHGIVLYFKRIFTYKRKTTPPFQIIGD
jgi:hypothetical protein